MTGTKKVQIPEKNGIVPPLVADMPIFFGWTYGKYIDKNKGWSAPKKNGKIVKLIYTSTALQHKTINLK